MKESIEVGLEGQTGTEGNKGNIGSSVEVRNRKHRVISVSMGRVETFKFGRGNTNFKTEEDKKD